MGPMTGRAAGYCAGYDMPGYANPVPGPGFGRGSGRGFGWRQGWRQGRRHAGCMPYGWGDMPPVAARTREHEKQFLQSQAESLQIQLNEIRKRLDDMNSQQANNV